MHDSVGHEGRGQETHRTYIAVFNGADAQLQAALDSIRSVGMCTHVSAGTTSFVHDGCYFLSGELHPVQISPAEHQLNTTSTHGHDEIGAMSCKQAWDNWKKAGQGGDLSSYLEIGQAVRR